MIVNRLKTNRVTNPLGFDYSDGGIRLSFVAGQTDAKKMTAARIEVAIIEK